MSMLTPYKKIFESDAVCSLGKDEDNCSLSAIELLTGKSYEHIKDLAGNWFKKGMPVMQTEMILSKLGLKFVRIRQDLIGKSIKEVEAILQKENINSKYLAMINIKNDNHGVVFLNGKAYNTLGLTKNKIKYISEWK